MPDVKMMLLIDGVEYELADRYDDPNSWEATNLRERLERLVSTGDPMGRPAIGNRPPERFKIKTASGVGELVVNPERVSSVALIAPPNRGMW